MAVQETRTRVVVALGVVALAAVVTSLIALRSVSDRSDRLDQLTDDFEAVSIERDELATELERTEASAAELSGEMERAAASSAAVESRWLAAVAVSADYSPSESLLLAVEAATRSRTTESVAALGQLLFADARTDPPIVELEHDGPVWVTDAASGADVIVTGSDDTTAKLWSGTGELLATLAHPGRVRTVGFSADSRTIATGSADGSAIMWTVTGDEIASIQHADQVNHIAIGGDGALMASAGHDGAVLITDTEAGEIQHELQHPDIVWTVALSEDEHWVASGGQDGIARLWDLDTGAEIATYDLGQPVTVVDFSPDGRWLFVGGQQGNTIIIEAGGTEDEDVGPPLEGAFRGGVVDMDWHPDGTELAVVSLGGIHRYDLPTRTLKIEHRLAGGARGVAYGPDGTWFATASGDFQFSFGEIAFWGTEAGSKLLSLNLGGPVESIATSRTGSVLASFRSVEDLVEVGGAWLVPGPNDWLTLACEGTDGTISELTWSRLTGEATSHETNCP